MILCESPTVAIFVALVHRDWVRHRSLGTILHPLYVFTSLEESQVENTMSEVVRRFLILCKHTQVLVLGPAYRAKRASATLSGIRTVVMMIQSHDSMAEEI